MSMCARGCGCVWGRARASVFFVHAGPVLNVCGCCFIILCYLYSANSFNSYFLLTVPNFFYKACRVVSCRAVPCLVLSIHNFASDRHRFNIERFGCYVQFMACYLSGFVLIRKFSSHCLYVIVPHEQNLYNEATDQSQLKWHIRRLHQSYLFKNELTKVNSNLWSMSPEHPCLTPFWKHAHSHVFSLFVSFKLPCLFA